MPIACSFEAKLRWKMQRNMLLMHNMERFLKELNEALCIEKHLTHLSAMKKLFERTVKIINEMKIACDFHLNCEFEKECYFT